MPVQDLDQVIDNINTSIESMRSNEKEEIKNSDLPSNLQLMLSGVTNSKAIDFLFSANLDKLIEKLLNMLESGEIEKILQNEEKMNNLFGSVGIGRGTFKGPVSRSIIQNIQRSLDSKKFNNMKSKLRKIQLIIKNLRKQAKYLKDPELQKKYKEAVYAIEKVIKLVASIYRNRRIISKRVLDGLTNIVKEDYMPEETLEALVF
jgi:hypothetical protein